MPKIKKPTAANLSAITADVVAPKMYRNRLVLSKVFYPKKSASKKKKEANERFKEANEYAKHVLLMPGMKELYAKGIDGKNSNAHNVAVKDFLNAPVIHDINLREYHGIVGDRLRINVTDDFQVTSVVVVIKNKEGKILEKGAALKYKRNPKIWIYTTIVNNAELEGTKITVKAMDWPENETEMELVIGASVAPA